MKTQWVALCLKGSTYQNRIQVWVVDLGSVRCQSRRYGRKWRRALGVFLEGCWTKTKALPVWFTARKSYHTLLFNHSFLWSIWKNKVLQDPTSIKKQGEGRKDLVKCRTWEPGLNYTVHGILQARITGLGNLSLLQGIFPTQGSNPGVPQCRWVLYHLSHQGSPRILEWVAYPFSRASSRPRNRTGVSCIAGVFFTSWAIRETWA